MRDQRPLTPSSRPCATSPSGLSGEGCGTSSGHRLPHLPGRRDPRRRARPRRTGAREPRSWTCSDPLRGLRSRAAESFVWPLTVRTLTNSLRPVPHHSRADDAPRTRCEERWISATHARPPSGHRRTTRRPSAWAAPPSASTTRRPCLRTPRRLPAGRPTARVAGPVSARSAQGRAVSPPLPTPRRRWFPPPCSRTGRPSSTRRPAADRQGTGPAPQRLEDSSSSALRKHGTTEPGRPLMPRT